MEGISKTLPVIGTPMSVMTNTRRRSGVLDSDIIARVILAHTRCKLSAGMLPLRYLAATTGNTVTATTSDIHTAMAMVRARSANNCPSTSSKNMTGIKIATVVAVDAMRAPNTSFVPRWAQSSMCVCECGSLFSISASALLRVLTMFSSTTIAASSTKPTAKASPASEMILSERPVS